MGRGDHMIPEAVPVSSLTASSGHNDTSAGPWHLEFRSSCLAW
jgi:hypothetical protein